jgi:very-short-patch-repair endonuclease
MDDETALADQHGLVSTRAVEMTGMSRRELARLVSRGRLERVARGWYVLGAVANALDQLPPAERRKGRHALTTRATLNIFEGRVVASHHSALILHGLPTYCADLSTVHVTRVTDDHSRARRGLVVHERVDGAGTTDDRVIEPVVAVVQSGMTNGALAALVAADAGLHQGLIQPDDLQRAVGLLGGPRAWSVRRALLHADGRAESPGETRLREALRAMGVAVTPQVRVQHGGFLAVVDLMLDDARVVVEFDGWLKYGRPDAYRMSATPTDVVVAEKIREDRIRALGYVVVRVMWGELDDLIALRRKILAAIALSRLLPAA